MLYMLVCPIIVDCITYRYLRLLVLFTSKRATEGSPGILDPWPIPQKIKVPVLKKVLSFLLFLLSRSAYDHN